MAQAEGRAFARFMAEMDAAAAGGGDEESGTGRPRIRRYPKRKDHPGKKRKRKKK